MTDQHPVGSRLDPWIESYAARTAGMKVSEIRALFAVASRPEVVSLAGGRVRLLSRRGREAFGRIGEGQAGADVQHLGRLTREQGRRGIPVRAADPVHAAPEPAQLLGHVVRDVAVRLDQHLLAILRP